MEHEIYNTGQGDFRHPLISNPEAGSLEETEFHKEDVSMDVSWNMIYVAVGYQNLNHFYKYFRIRTGVTPAVYLKQGQDEVHESE